MNFGSLQIVTAWRLTRGGAMCQAIVMDGEEGFRLVVIEDQQIVGWECVRSVHELRRTVAATLKARYDEGWEAAAPAYRVGQRQPSNSGRMNRGLPLSGLLEN
jgi:hypothetical protein